MYFQCTTSTVNEFNFEIYDVLSFYDYTKLELTNLFEVSFLQGSCCLASSFNFSDNVTRTLGQNPIVSLKSCKLIKWIYEIWFILMLLFDSTVCVYACLSIAIQ